MTSLHQNELLTFLKYMQEKKLTSQQQNEQIKEQDFFFLEK